MLKFLTFKIPQSTQCSESISLYPVYCKWVITIHNTQTANCVVSNFTMPDQTQKIDCVRVCIDFINSNIGDTRRTYVLNPAPIHIHHHKSQEKRKMLACFTHEHILPRTHTHICSGLLDSGSRAPSCDHHAIESEYLFMRTRGDHKSALYRVDYRLGRKDTCGRWGKGFLRWCRKPNEQFLIDVCRIYICDLFNILIYRGIYRKLYVVLHE